MGYCSIPIRKKKILNYPAENEDTLFLNVRTYKFSFHKLLNAFIAKTDC